MSVELPQLPYSMDALEPVISKETLEFHYGKHHQGYVNKLNTHIADTELDALSLEQILLLQDSNTFNNAAQIWNHTFYWNSMSPNGGGQPGESVGQALTAQFGSVADFISAFNKKAAGNFGSGWTWLVIGSDGQLAIVNSANAETPFTMRGVTPLLTVDVWEHAYYIDYRNDRGTYLDSFWKLVNWQFVEDNLNSAQ